MRGRSISMLDLAAVTWVPVVSTEYPRNTARIACSPYWHTGPGPGTAGPHDLCAMPWHGMAGRQGKATASIHGCSLMALADRLADPGSWGSSSLHTSGTYGGENLRRIYSAIYSIVFCFCEVHFHPGTDAKTSFKAERPTP